MEISYLEFVSNLLNGVSRNSGDLYLLILGVETVLTTGGSLVDTVHLIVETGSLHTSHSFIQFLNLLALPTLPAFTSAPIAAYDESAT